MNIALSYMYRDGANYKQRGEVVFANPGNMPVSLVDHQIRATLFQDNLFIARQVAIPEQFMVESPFDKDDHAWHEYEEVEKSNKPVTDDRSIGHFIEDMRRANNEGWDYRQVPEELHKILMQEAETLAAEFIVQVAQ